MLKDAPEEAQSRVESIKSITVPKYRIRGQVVEYVVSCQNEKSMWQVFRRYQAFKKLHADLSAQCSFGAPNHCKFGVVPVLSGSHLFEATNQSPELVEKRRRYLEVYLQQLLVPSNNFYPDLDALKVFLTEDQMPVYFRSKTTKLVPGLSMAMDSEAGVETLDDFESAATDGPAEPTWQCIAYTPNTDAPETAVHPSIPDLSASDGAKTHGARDGQMLTVPSGGTGGGGSPGGSRSPPQSTSPAGSPQQRPRRPDGDGAAAASGGAPGMEGSPSNDVDALPSGELREQCMKCNYVSVVDYPREEWQDFGLCGNCGHFARHWLIESDPDGRLSHEPGERPSGAPAVVSPDEGDAASARLDDKEPVIEVPPRDLGGASIADFTLITTLGRGTFGKVMKVQHRPTGRIMAMKVLTKSVVSQRRMVEYIREERDIMAMLPPHPFVVTMHYALQTDHHLYFLLDYLPGGELYSHIHPKGHVSEAVARFYICEVILAIEHIHRYDVCHRDLKPENVVIAADGHIALTDFGLARSRFSKSRRRSFVGSAEYLAPETVRNEVQTKALDWWSVGVMLYEMLVGRTPFHGATNTEVYNNVVHKPLDLNKKTLSPDAAHLIKQLLDRSPGSRLSRPDDIKHHPFFKSVDWDAFMRREVKPPFVPDLACNDTKYFAREFTSEWACVQKSSATDAQTLRQWREKFDNFDVSKEMTHSPSNNAGSSSVDRSIAETIVEPWRFVGAWRLMRLELRSSKGQVTYPWGAEVAGLLIYTTAGYFSMQLAPIKRTKLKRHSAEDMAQAFVGYVSQFGSYHLRAGWNFIVHAPTAALNPNMSSTLQRRYFQFNPTHFNTLTLTTDEFTAEDQERLIVRTVTTWERVPARPGFSQTDSNNGASPASSPTKRHADTSSAAAAASPSQAVGAAVAE